MNTRKITLSILASSTLLGLCLLAACHSATPATQTASPPVPQANIIRIKAGIATPFKDSAGNTWLPDQGFEGGDTASRDADLKIQGTNDPDLYRSERYGMDSFSMAVPNGKYTMKLYFAETYDGINGPGDRVFSFNVQGKDFNDFDIWVKAGGIYKAYVQTVNDVKVTDGKIRMSFTPGTQSTEINAIEIIPN